MSKNKLVDQFLEQIENEELSLKLSQILKWIEDKYPSLLLEYKWNQPMLTRKGTYIMGFSVSKKHLGVGLEAAVMQHFKGLLDELKVEHGKMIFRIKEDDMVNYELLKEIIDYVIELKKDVKSFWL